MNIGIIGLGVVGGAVASGLQDLGHKIHPHDIKMNTSINDVLESEICFICVPTPSTEDGSCDTSIVDKVVGELSDNNFSGIVAVKSTVEPGTTKRLQNQYKNLEICFVPEFLRERCAVSDFTDNHDLCVIGTREEVDFNKLKACHGRYPEKFVQLSVTEAELVKYFNNVYNSTLIIFANSFYELCKSLDANYSEVKNAATQRDHINDKYLDCNENLRGFGGVCLPKDTRALAALVEKNNLDVDFFKMLLSENKKYKTTTYEGMRD